MRVGFFQFAPRFGEVSHNLDTIVEALDRADADLIVLPELCASGYQFVSQHEVMTLSESVPNGPTTQRLIDLAKRRRMTIVAGLPERAGAACYNSAVVVGPSGFIGCYRKTHLFFEETLFFTPGDTGFQVWDIGPAKIGVTSRGSASPPLEKDKEKRKNPVCSAFILPLTASAASLLRQSRLETLLASRVGEPREKVVALAAHPFHPQLEEEWKKKEGPCWTRAVGDQPAYPLESRREKPGQFQLSFPTEQACEFRSSSGSQGQGPDTPLVGDRRGITHRKRYEAIEK
ncbi:MAG: hypothetical protein E8D41_08810 [Nitrospira sp.]|nr:MAG: hypothetical protein E8D41_08810 [Nitrospira sp.]